ncbi:MAG: urease subunit beta [Ktedonobacteraceae bacterium]
MRLTPKEQDRLTIFTLAELARKRRTRGLKLNHPEAVALLSDEVLEEARAGKTYAEVIAHGMQVLYEDEVLPGVAELIPTLMIEPLFDDGMKLVVLHAPIRKRANGAKDKQRASTGATIDPIIINAGKATITLLVTNTSDRPVHITSHLPFWEVNARMQFDRTLAQGYRLDIPAGGAVRWEPGETKEVQLCRLK